MCGMDHNQQDSSRGLREIFYSVQELDISGIVHC
jgi:hypothetical protein